MKKLNTPINENEIDKGILPAVKIMREHGFETFESCEGGDEHAYAESTIFFYGNEFDCLRAYEICVLYNLNVDYVGRIFQKEGLEIGTVWNKPFNKIAFLKHPETEDIFKP